MMLEILESGQALYALAAVCVLGLLARLTARTLYRRLIRETDNMALTKNRCLREFKQKAENTYRLNQGISNTQAYLEKQIASYRFCGLSLNGWANLSGQMTVLCFLLGGAGAFLAYWYRSDTYYIVLYAAMGILAGLLTLFVDMGVNLPEKRSQLLCALQDYLENSLFSRLSRETAAAMDYAGGQDKPASQVHDGPRAVSRDGGKDGILRVGTFRERGRTANGESGGRKSPAADEDGDLRESAEREAVGQRGNIRSIARSGRGDGPGTDRGGGYGGEDRPAGRSQRRSDRPGGKGQVKDAEEELPPQQGRSDAEDVRRSLEQIAASREKGRSDGDWLKELSPGELELVGEILKKYLE